MSDAKKLKEKLFNKKVNIYQKLSDPELEDVKEFSEKYKTFLDKSKTEREVVSYFVSKAEKKGFKPFIEGEKYESGDKIYKINRNKSVCFAVIGKNGCKNGFKIAVSHIDSPRIDIKQNPLYEQSELALMKTHYYGGIKKYQWTSIPLSLHGRVPLSNGSHLDVSIGEKDDEPCFYISDLLPHLAHEQMQKPMSKAIEGESLNVLVGSHPFKDDSESELVKLNILKLLNEKYGIKESDFLCAELELVPCFKARDIGFDRSLIGAYGHDDRVCSFASFKAMMSLKNPEYTCVSMFADKEEIGSTGNTGMQSMFLKYFLADLAELDGIKGRHAISKSKVLSADVDAAFDPNYPSSFDEMNSSFLNHGAVITKYTGHGGKYDSSDASSEFLQYVEKIFKDNGVYFQFGLLGKVDTGGGGTVAKYVANLNMDVVDVGVAVLSMHSPFEVISKVDLYQLNRGIKVFFEN